MIKLVSIADCISIINAIFGFLSIVMVSIGEIRLAFSFILLALLADGLDGIIARKIKESKIGEFLESMADMTSLGIAPAVFIYMIYYNIVNCCITDHVFLLLTLIMFLLTTIIRLASFHIIKEKGKFIGLPASASTILILIMAYFEIEIVYILPFVIILSLAMISNISFPKPDYKIDAIAGILIILTIIIEKNYQGIAPLILFIAIGLYVIIGPFYLLIKKKKS